MVLPRHQRQRQQHISSAALALARRLTGGAGSETPCATGPDAGPPWTDGRLPCPRSEGPDREVPCPSEEDSGGLDEGEEEL